jgi:predicted metal-dependent hydrolase
MEVIVKRSKRRKKTIQARMVDGKMEVLAPAAIPDEALKDHISRLQARLVKRAATRDDAILIARAQHLNRRYFEGRLKWNSIQYSSRQERRRGSCNFTTKTIRISERLAEMPQWVEDYVKARAGTLLEPNHGKRFKDCERYPGREGHRVSHSIRDIGA